MERSMPPMTTQSSKTGEIEIVGPVTAEFAQVLTPDAMKFVATLVRTFSGRREELLQKRALRQAEIDAGKMPDFLPETEHIRQGSWTIAPVPADLQERRGRDTESSRRKKSAQAVKPRGRLFKGCLSDSH